MIKFLIEKEFKQIFRDAFIPKILVMMPLMMMLVFPWAANQSVKNLRLSVVDNDRSTFSERLIHKIISSDYFKLTDFSATNAIAMQSIESGNADIILEIEPDFEKNLMRENVGRVLVSANSINGMKGGIGSTYLMQIVNDFSNELRENAGITGVSTQQIPKIFITPHYKFNPHLDYKVFMIPALMVMLLTMLIGFLPALNIVGEKEIGTIEQINVTPIKKITFVLAKLIPYWLIGFAVLALCMSLAAGVYGIFPVGSLLTIFIFSLMYIFVMSGFGLVISNYSNTMQQAMFVMFFFVMLFIMMSGLYSPISAMPRWAQVIAHCNPLTYLMEVMRLVYLKGSAFREMLPQFFALCAFAIALNAWAVASYRKTS